VARTRFVDISEELAGDGGGDSGMAERLGDRGGGFTGDKGGDVKGDDGAAVRLSGDCAL